MLTVLATLDGSEQSRSIIPALEKLATGQPIRLRLLTVVERPAGTAHSSTIARSPTAPISGVGSGPLPLGATTAARPPERNWAETEEQATDRVMNEARQQLEAVAGPLRRDGTEVEVDVIVRDDPADAIVDYARQNSFDMIAMATHGRTGLRSVVQGSVASEVVRSGVAPVLLVRPVK